MLIWLKCYKNDISQSILFKKKQVYDKLQVEFIKI